MKSNKRETELLQQDFGTDDTNKNEELVTRTDVPGTPFTIIGIKNEYFGVMGQYRLTEPNTSKELIKAELTQITWDRLVQVIAIMIESRDKLNLNILENEN